MHDHGESLSPPARPSVADVFADLPTLRTRRLLLRRLTMEDAHDVFTYASDPEVAAYVIWERHRTIEDSRVYLATVIESYRNADVSVWGFEDIATGRLIGTGGFGYWNLTHGRAEIGYSLARPYWNRGLATEAAAMMMAFGFRRMRLHRIEAYCDSDNIGSARVMQKLGMQREGTLRQRVKIKGQFRDLELYAILAGEWSDR